MYIRTWMSTRLLPKRQEVVELTYFEVQNVTGTVFNSNPVFSMAPSAFSTPCLHDAGRYEMILLHANSNPPLRHITYTPQSLMVSYTRPRKLHQYDKKASKGDNNGKEEARQAFSGLMAAPS
jgi:hypothetical protein